MNEQERYDTVDMPFYYSEVAPVLPPEVLDFHAHIWTRDQWLGKRGESMAVGSRAEFDESPGAAGYMKTTLDYSAADLLRDGQRMFPDRAFNAVCFGQPTPAVDTEATNAYAAEVGKSPGRYPLMVTGRGMVPRDELRREILGKGFFGYKVYLDWIGNGYGNISVQDMLGPAEMELADEMALVVLLHVPGERRLADKEVLRGVTDYARSYPNARIVLAHCGRCYLPAEMKEAIGAIRNLDNIYMDTAMVMDPLVLRIVLDNIDSSRVLFATDLPVSAMRGRRVYVMDHWVDLVLEGYQSSDYRAPYNGMRATFMTYEIAVAIRVAAECVGLKDEQTKRIFYQNGMDLLGSVANGSQLNVSQSRLQVALYE